MNFKTPEAAEENEMIDRVPDTSDRWSWPEQRVDGERDRSHGAMNNLLALQNTTATPAHGAEAHADHGGEHAAEAGHAAGHGDDDKKKDLVQRTLAGAQKMVTDYIDFKPVKKDETPKTKLQRLGNVSLGGLQIGTGALASAIAVGPNIPVISTAHNILQSVPYVGPTITSMAGSVWSGLGTLATSLGLETGAAATNGLLSFLPTSAAPFALGLAGLYAAGKVKQFFTRREYKGIVEPMTEALKTPFQLLGAGMYAPYKLLMNAPSYALKIPLKTAQWTYNQGKSLIGQPVAWTWNNVVTPKKLGFAGAALAGLALAPMTGGSSLALAGAGYLGGNAAQSIFGGASGGDAHDAHGGGHGH